MTGGQASTDTAERLARIGAIAARIAMVIAPLDDVIRLVRDLSDGLEHPLELPLKTTAAMLGDILIAYEEVFEHPVQLPLKPPEPALQTSPPTAARIGPAGRRTSTPTPTSAPSSAPALQPTPSPKSETTSPQASRPTAAPACPDCPAGGSARARP